VAGKRNAFDGAVLPFRALGLIRQHPELWGFILVPVVINIVVGVLLYSGLLFGGLRAIDRLIAEGGFWIDLLQGLLQALLGLGLFVLVGFLLVRFGVVLGAPWYGQLSERIEHLLLGAVPPQPPLSAATIVRDIGRALLFELKKLTLTLVVTLPLLLFNLVPVAGQVIVLVGSVAFGAVIACLDFFDGALERRRLRFRAKLGYVFGNMPASGSFGLLAAFLCAIPLLNLLAIPLCVVAGTMFFCENREQKIESRE
jgi:CysZ protein